MSEEKAIRTAIETGEFKFIGRAICAGSRALGSLRWEEKGLQWTLLRLDVQNARWKNGDIKPAKKALP